MKKSPVGHRGAVGGCGHRGELLAGVLVFYIPLLESRNRLLAIEELLAGVLGINILFQKISVHCFMYGIP